MVVDAHVPVHRGRGHDLARAVTPGARRARRGDPQHREECPHVDDCGEPRAKRARRQVGGETRNRRHDEVRVGGADAGQNELEAVGLHAARVEDLRGRRRPSNVSSNVRITAGRAELEAHPGEAHEGGRRFVLVRGKGGDIRAHTRQTLPAPGPRPPGARHSPGGVN